MNLNALTEIDPWDWPEESADEILAVLGDRHASAELRQLAAELGGEYVVMNDEIAAQLLAILGDPSESEELRAEAAMSLGPVLEHGFTEGFEQDGLGESDVPISEETYDTIRTRLHELYDDRTLPDPLRQRILESAARAPLDWIAPEIRALRESNDESWRHSAVFCMAHVAGFDREILASLASDDPAIQYEAVRAAGNWGTEGAWPMIESLLSDPNTEKPMLLNAIDASSNWMAEATGVLLELSQSDDEDIAEAALEVMAWSGQLLDDEDDDSDEEL